MHRPALLSIEVIFWSSLYFSNNDCGSAEHASVMEDVKNYSPYFSVSPRADSRDQGASWAERTSAEHLPLRHRHFDPHGATHNIHKLLQMHSWVAVLCQFVLYRSRENSKEVPSKCAYADTTQLKGLDDFLVTIIPIKTGRSLRLGQQLTRRKKHTIVPLPFNCEVILPLSYS